MTKSQRPAIAIGFIGIAIYILLSLASYNPQDVGEFFPYNSSYQNYCGKNGAVLAHWLFKWLGCVAWSLPELLLLAAGAILVNISISKISIAWVCCLAITLVWSCCLASYCEPSGIYLANMPSYGGMIGIYLVTNLNDYLGKATGWLLLCFGVGLGLYAISLYWEYRFLLRPEKTAATPGAGKK